MFIQPYDQSPRSSSRQRRFLYDYSRHLINRGQRDPTIAVAAATHDVIENNQMTSHYSVQRWRRGIEETPMVLGRQFGFPRDFGGQLDVDCCHCQPIKNQHF
jgi:hypothetical protein